MHSSQLFRKKKKNKTRGLFISERYRENSGKTATVAGLFVKKNRIRYKELIGRLDIREPKTS
ncbi:hypothetical protein C5167_004695 [Papaver somniferum]|uniref:Uncharacterized protein n=1 Tax=Papaver somniferum TaxID=3469 RepID=A0A4Y7JC65_PAPSO|nr:hypothetical protein C5167_004695 [Papaver somniferum]